VLQIRRKQVNLLQVLEIKRIAFVKRDIAVNEEDKREFRRRMRSVNNAAAMPPQIFQENRYCGVSIAPLYNNDMKKLVVPSPFYRTACIPPQTPPVHHTASED